MTRGTTRSLGAVFQRAALPLGWYYAVTLALPLANGAGESGAAFVKHAFVVLFVPLVLIVSGYAALRLARDLLERAGSIRH